LEGYVLTRHNEGRAINKIRRIIKKVRRVKAAILKDERITVKRRFTRSFGGNLIVIFILAVTGAFMALPLVYALVSAFKPFEEIFIFPPRFFVRRPTWDNFTNLFIISSNMWVPFTRYVFNSLFVTFAATFLHVLFASAAAYPLAKHDFPGKNKIFSVAVISLMFVPQVTFIPQYVVMAKLGWINTYAALILPPVGAALGLFLMKQFMENIPVPMLESARIDGANEYRIFLQIVMPNVKPAWLTLTIFSFQGVWNNSSLLQFIYSEELKLLPNAMNQIITGSSIARLGVGMAASVFLLLPPLVLFISIQNRVIETMAYAGIKE
jgi:putative chitobiose transport system permease protein